MQKLLAYVAFLTATLLIFLLLLYTYNYVKAHASDTSSDPLHHVRGIH